MITKDPNEGLHYQTLCSFGIFLSLDGELPSLCFLIAQSYSFSIGLVKQEVLHSKYNIYIDNFFLHHKASALQRGAGELRLVHVVNNN